MKTKVILFIAISAIACLSFGFSTQAENNETQNYNTSDRIEAKSSAEPIGGFVSEDRF